VRSWKSKIAEVESVQINLKFYTYSGRFLGFKGARGELLSYESPKASTVFGRVWDLTKTPLKSSSGNGDKNILDSLF